MADDTPDQPQNDEARDDARPDGDAPAPRRRAAPRKAAAKPAAPRKAKSVVTRAEEAVSRAAAAAKDAVVDAEERVVRAVKPRSTKRAAPAKRTTRQTTAKEQPAKRSGAKSGGRSGRRGDDGKSVLTRAREAVTGPVGAAVAASLVTAGIMSLRGSSSRNLGTPAKPIDITGSGDKGPGHGVDVHGTAHQPDGTDSTASFQAGIADENTVPDQA